MPTLTKGNILLFSTEEKEKLVTRILSYDSTTSNEVVASHVNLSREGVRKIRVGLQWGNILPDLPRLSSDRRQRCTDCNLCDLRMWQCSINMPGSTENGTLNRRFAIDCAAYTQNTSITSLFNCKDHAIINAAAQKLYRLGLTKKQVAMVLRLRLSFTPDPEMLETYPPTPQAAAQRQPQKFSFGELWRGPDGPNREPGRHYRVCLAPNDCTSVVLYSVGGHEHITKPIAATFGFTLVAPAKPKRI